METRIVALLDVLGFRQHLDRYRNNSDRGLELYRAAWEGARIHLHDTTVRWSQRVLTDNIVLIGDSVGQEGPSLFDFILAAGRFQFELAIRGFWLRGAVCLGEVFEDGEFVYGAALAEAHSLEVNAEFPRIVVSSQLKSLAVREHLVSSKSSKVSDLAHLADANGMLPFIRDEDQAYVDYLLCYHQKAMAKPSVEAIRNHAGRIAVGLEMAERDYESVFGDEQSSLAHKTAAARLRAKLRWLVNYHDSYCRLAHMGADCFVSEN